MAFNQEPSTQFVVPANSRSSVAFAITNILLCSNFACKFSFSYNPQADLPETNQVQMFCVKFCVCECVNVFELALSSGFRVLREKGACAHRISDI